MSKQLTGFDQAPLDRDRGDAHMFICRAGVRWRIERIFNGIYFNVHSCGPEGRNHEYTIICPPHKQENLACMEQDWPLLDGPSNGGSDGWD